MPDFTKCNICDNPQSFDSAKERIKIPSNVREFKNEIFTVWRCANCLSLHSMEDVPLDRYYAKYPVQNHKLDFPTWCAYQNRLRLLKKLGLRKDHAILDFGCGPGLFVTFLKRQGYRALGYDLYEKSFSNPDVLKQTFDVVLSYDVIEHTKDPRAFLNDLIGVTKTGGLLGIGTPNAAQIDLGKPQKYFMELHQPYHQHLLSENALVQLGAGHGLHLRMVHRKFYFDTIVPMINTRFIERYVHTFGNTIDVLFEKLHPWRVLISPTLLFWGLFGYFIPTHGNMVVFFDKKG